MRLSIELRKKLPSQEIADEEADVGGTLCETAHEVGKPVAAEGNIDPDAIAILDQLALEIGAHAVQHLKFEIVLGNLLSRGKANGRGDHMRVVGGDAVVEAAG